MLRKRSASTALVPYKPRKKVSRTLISERTNKSYKLYRSPFASTPFPSYTTKTLTYVQSTFLAFEGGIATPAKFSVNGLYAPAVSPITSHQPMYFDQLMAIYNHYTVTSSMCEVTIIDLFGQSSSDIYCLHIDDDTSVYADALVNAEFAGSDFAGAAAYRSPTVKLRQSWKSKHKFPSDAVSDSDMRGTVGANPLEQQFYVLTGIDPATSRTANCQYVIKITYTAVFSELKTIGPS